MAAALFSLPDPAADAHGDGSYVLPSQPALRESAFDIRSLRAENAGGKLQLVISLGSVENPWHAAGGWSGVTLDIFVKTQSGGDTALADLGLITPGDSGWQEHYRLNGFETLHERVPDGQDKPVTLNDHPQLSLRGTDITLLTQLPASEHYAYWVTSSAYTPFNASGVLPASGNGGPNDLRSARASSPAPLDVLYSGDQRSVYLSGVLPPVGQSTNYHALILLGLAVLSLLLAAALALPLWRRAKLE